MADVIYCKFIQGNVPKNKLPKSCRGLIGETQCEHCAPSPQLAVGVTSEQLIENFKGW